MMDDMSIKTNSISAAVAVIVVVVVVDGNDAVVMSSI